MVLPSLLQQFMITKFALYAKLAVIQSKEET